MSTNEMRTLPENACIRRVPIFDKLTEEELNALQSVIQSRKFGKGEYIFREGERSEAFHIVHSGVVKIAKCSDAGKEQVIRFLFAGDFFGQFSLLQQKSHYAFAEVLEDASVCLIRHADFRALLEQNATMTYRFLLAVSERLAEADEWMSAISLTDAEERLAKMLLLFYNKGEPGNVLLRLPIAKKELASLLGTTPETVSRKLTQLQSQGVLNQENRGRIRILDLGKLRKIAGG